MSTIVKILITVNILISQSYALCEKVKSEKPTFGNARSIASKIESIDNFITTDRSTDVGEGIFLKNDKARHHSDDRKAKNKDSPRFLDAVGRLSIDDGEGNVKYCGGTLVAFTKNQRSRIIATSAHCLKGDNINWKTTTKDSIVIERKILKAVEIDGNFDYAFLLLDNFVETKDVMPLIIDFEGQNSVNGAIGDLNADVHVAGYSADAEVGLGGKILTYDTTYKRIMSTEDSRRDLIGGSTEGITTYSGASGGAVILTYEDDMNEVNLGKQHVLMGIIKGGVSNDFASSNGVEGSNNTRFTYYERFLGPLYETLIEYNGAVDGIEW